MPWPQLSLMASLCFGIASFVLPDSVNDNVDWLLWGLCDHERLGRGIQPGRKKKNRSHIPRRALNAAESVPSSR